VLHRPIETAPFHRTWKNQRPHLSRIGVNLKIYWGYMQTSLKAIIAVGVLMIALSVYANGLIQSLDPSPHENVILEVSATDNDGYTGTAHTHLVLRILSDQDVEWQSSVSSDSKQFNSFRRTMTKNEFNRIKSVVDDPKIRKLRSRYELMSGVDTSTVWKISISHPGQPQIIETVQSSTFRPSLMRLIKRPMPDTFVKLGCTIQNLSDDVMGRGDVDLDSDCKRILKIPVIERSH
jgi:hypothetical protein